MRSNLSFIPELPKTKKGIYDTIKAHFKVGTVCSIHGSRRVGKTILLRQLCEELNGYYFDVEKYQCEYGFNKCENEIIEDLTKIWQESEVDLIAIDEITKLPYSIIGTITEAIKTSFNKGIIYTGSIPASVELIDSRVMPHEIFDVNPLNYVEYCDWNESSKGEDSYKDYLSYANSLQYFNKQGPNLTNVESTNFFLDSKVETAIKGSKVEETNRIKKLKDLTADVLSYCIKSVNRNYNQNSKSPVDFLEEVFKQSSTDKFKKLILCTIFSGKVDLNSKFKFSEMPQLDLDEDSRRNYASLKDFTVQNEELLTKFEKFLLDSGLAKEFFEWEFNKDRPESNGLDASCKVNRENLLFEYPCFTNAVTSSNQYENCDNLWIEEEITRQAGNVLYGFNFGKFRDNNRDEIDIVSDFVAIEVKNSSWRQVSKRVTGYCRLCCRIGINNLIITVNDSSFLGKYKSYESQGVKVLVVNFIDLSYGLAVISFNEVLKNAFFERPVNTLISLLELKAQL